MRAVLWTEQARADLSAIRAFISQDSHHYASVVVYWQQGHSTERDFIYVTTQTLTQDQLHALSDDVGSERSLLILCGAFRGRADGLANLTVKKIPKEVLARCEWGHDDYSLRVENLPQAPAPKGQQGLGFDDEK